MTFCILGENCSVFDRRTETSGLSHRNPLCDGCRNRVRRELNLLRYDYVDLSQLIPKTDARGDARIFRPKPGSSPPLDVQVFTLREQIAGVARCAELALRRHLGMALPSVKVREGYGLSDAVSYLHPRVDDLARMPPFEALWGSQGAVGAVVDKLDGAAVLMLFGALHRQARKMCGLDPRTIRVPGSCPSCSVPALKRLDDDPGRLWCQNCNLQLTRQEYLNAQRMLFAPVTPAPEPR